LVYPGTQVDKILWWYDRLEGSSKALVVLGDTLAPVDIAALWQDAMEDLARDELLGALVCGGPLTTVDSLESLAAAHQVLAGAASLEVT
jgi:hypothetical protein